MEKLHRGLHSQATISATSDGSTNRPSGMRASRSARRSAVSDCSIAVRTGVDADLVLADYTMPRMTGVELAAHVAGLLPGVPVVLMTGYSAASVSDASPHISAVLQKPFRAKAMADVLVVALGRRSAEKLGEL